jgi:hypothetical protein
VHAFPGEGGALLLAALPTAACGALGPLAQIVQPPRFEDAGQPAEIRLMPPTFGEPSRGAAVRLWVKVTNLNAFSFTLSTLAATLTLEGSRAATGDFPLGLPLGAGQESIVPLDLSISLADIPGLSGALRQAMTGAPIGYQLDGTVGVDAGRFGQPTFGPMLLARGELRTVRQAGQGRRVPL